MGSSSWGKTTFTGRVHSTKATINLVFLQQMDTKMALASPYLVWIDLEMSGLTLPHDRILEIATIVTDNDLNIVEEGPNLVIHQADALLDGMDAWCQKTHGESGLTARVKASSETETTAEEKTLAFISKYVTEKSSPLCGNTIHSDRRFLDAYMPRLSDFLHYRHIDVSTIKELAKRWQPALFEGHQKQSAHTALSDIRESIAELAYYRQHWLKDAL